jgi:hypothetical protein
MLGKRGLRGNDRRQRLRLGGSPIIGLQCTRKTIANQVALSDSESMNSTRNARCCRAAETSENSAATVAGT